MYIIIKWQVLTGSYISVCQVGGRCFLLAAGNTLISCSMGWNCKQVETNHNGAYSRQCLGLPGINWPGKWGLISLVVRLTFRDRTQNYNHHFGRFIHAVNQLPNRPPITEWYDHCWVGATTVNPNTISNSRSSEYVLVQKVYKSSRSIPHQTHRSTSRNLRALCFSQSRWRGHQCWRSQRRREHSGMESTISRMHNPKIKITECNYTLTQTNKQ